jgi:hypothetical protein
LETLSAKLKAMIHPDAARPGALSNLTAGMSYYYLPIVKKEEFAQAVAGCDLDPAIVREGKEYLFEERWTDVGTDLSHD